MRKSGMRAGLLAGAYALVIGLGWMLVPATAEDRGTDRLPDALAAPAVVDQNTGPARPTTVPILSGDSEGQPRLGYEALRDISPGHRALLKDIELDPGIFVDLNVVRFSALTRDAQIVVDGSAGARPMDMPDVVLLRGTVAGATDSRVFIGASPFGTHGYVQHDQVLHVVSSGPYAEHFAHDLQVHIARAEDLLDVEGIRPGCATDDRDPAFWPEGQPIHHAARRAQQRASSNLRGGDGGGDDPPCRVVRTAIDTDWQFTGNVFGGDTFASASYALTLLGAVSEIFRNDVNASLVAPYLRVWDGPTGIYQAGNTGGRLVEVRDHWRAHMEHIERDLVHLFSGANLGGGIAYLAVMCSKDWGYAVSADINGSFPMPMQGNNHNNWDLMVVAHEFGHNFAAPHTHNTDPPVDNCGNTDLEDHCEDAANGTIMSYCHICPGGLSNIALDLHPFMINLILNYLLEGECDLIGEATIAANDIAQTLQGVPVTIDVLSNDLAVSCDPQQVALDWFESRTGAGGMVELLAGEGPDGIDLLRYTPPGGFSGVDSFMYALEGGSSATVDVTVVAPRPADTPYNSHAGIRVAYYEIPESAQLPNFSTIEPYGFDVVSQVNYPSTSGNFATSGRHDLVAAAYLGFVEVPETAIYTFYTDSDDGSTLYIGDQLIVDNDGLHGMRERSGTIALAPGFHRIRVEFFENFGGAGLIVRYQGGSANKQAIPPSMWTHEVLDCPVDITRDGVVDVQDLLEVISHWGAYGALPADVNGDGAVSVLDLLHVIANWGSTCS